MLLALTTGESPYEFEYERLRPIIQDLGDTRLLDICEKYFAQDFLRSVWAISGRYEGELANFVIQQLFKPQTSRIPEFPLIFQQMVHNSREFELFARLLSSVSNLPVSGEIMLQNFDIHISVFHTELEPISQILLAQEISPRYFQLLVKLYFPQIFTKKSSWCDPQLPNNPPLDDTLEQMVCSQFFAKLINKMLHLPLREKLFEDWRNSDSNWFSAILIFAALHVGQTRVGKNVQNWRNLLTHHKTRSLHFPLCCRPHFKG